MGEKRERKLSVEKAFAFIETATEKLVDKEPPRPYLSIKSYINKADKLLKDGPGSGATATERAIFKEFLLHVEKQCGLSMRIFAGTLGQTRVGRFMSKLERRELVSLLRSSKEQEPFSKPINPIFCSGRMAQPTVCLNSLPGSRPATFPESASNGRQIECMHASPDHI